MTETLTVPALAGLIAPFLTAALLQVEMRPAHKRWIAIGVTVLLTGAGIFAVYQPTAWDEIARALAIGIGSMQAVYTAMKPVFDRIETGINPGETYNPRHLAPDDSRG